MIDLNIILKEQRVKGEKARVCVRRSASERFVLFTTNSVDIIYVLSLAAGRRKDNELICQESSMPYGVVLSPLDWETVAGLIHEIVKPVDVLRGVNRDEFGDDDAIFLRLLFLLYHAIHKSTRHFDFHMKHLPVLEGCWTEVAKKWLPPKEILPLRGRIIMWQEKHGRIIPTSKAENVITSLPSPPVATLTEDKEETELMRRMRLGLPIPAEMMFGNDHGRVSERRTILPQ